MTLTLTSTFIKPMYFTLHLHIWHECFSDKTCTFMTSVLFRHNIYIFYFSVFKTWYVKSWHQSFSDMTSTLITPVSLRQVIYIYNISVFLDVASTFMTFMFFRHDISIDDIRVFHMTSRFMTSVYFTWYQMKPFHLQMDDEDKLIR